MYLIDRALIVDVKLWHVLVASDGLPRHHTREARINQSFTRTRELFIPDSKGHCRLQVLAVVAYLGNRRNML